MRKWISVEFFGPMAIVLFCLLLPGVRAQNVQIISETGVPIEAKEDIQLAVDKTAVFFKETYRLELKKDVRIILVANKEAYAATLVREARIDQKEAERRARTTLGWSTASAIIQNAGEIPNARRRVYNMSHELVHKYQEQECSGKCSQIMWIYEGTAGALATRVVEICGLRPLTEHRKGWMQGLKQLSKQPELKELKTAQNWFAALDKYGSDPTYGFAGLAVLELIDRKGYPGVFDYFRRLRDSGPEHAFKKAFDLDLASFENEFGRALQ